MVEELSLALPITHTTSSAIDLAAQGTARTKLAGELEKLIASAAPAILSRWAKEPPSSLVS